MSASLVRVYGVVLSLPQGLDGCSQLEELYLDDNCIYKLDGLSRLHGLRRLSLSNNYLSQLDPSELEPV